MKFKTLTSKFRFVIAAAAAGIATLVTAGMSSEEVVRVWGTRLVLMIVCLPVLVMAVGIACIWPPEILTVMALIAALMWGVPLQWVLMATVALAVGYLGLLFLCGTKFRRQSLPLIIYEFGADRIVPYYAWLASPQGALFSGLITGMFVGIAILWARTMSHAVDSLSART